GFDQPNRVLWREPAEPALRLALSLNLRNLGNHLPLPGLPEQVTQKLGPAVDAGRAPTFCGVGEGLVLRAANLGRDDIDRQILLLAADEAGNAIPDRRGALVGVHRSHPRGCSMRLRGARQPHGLANASSRLLNQQGGSYRSTVTVRPSV